MSSQLEAVWRGLVVPNQTKTTFGPWLTLLGNNTPHSAAPVPPPSGDLMSPDWACWCQPIAELAASLLVRQMAAWRSRQIRRSEETEQRPQVRPGMTHLLVEPYVHTLDWVRKKCRGGSGCLEELIIQLTAKWMPTFCDVTVAPVLTAVLMPKQCFKQPRCASICCLSS